MGKKYRSKHLLSASAGVRLRQAALPLGAAAFFLFLCLGAEDAAKGTTMVLILTTLLCGAVFFPQLRQRATPPLLALFLMVLMDGVSLLYAPSGKFALYEFLQVAGAFCLALLLLCLCGGENPGRQAASVLEGCAALAGLVSIDLISTRLVSTPILWVLSLFSDAYRNLGGLEAGIRITSLFRNPNVFAGTVGLGVLLSLSLSLSAQKRWERNVHLVCLYLSALSFVLAFSMGASAAIVLAFLACLLLEHPDRRGELFLLMLRTLLLTVPAAGLISLTSFDAYTGFQPIPLLTAAIGAALLCLSERVLGPKTAQRLGRKLPVFIAAAVAALAALLLAAFLLTGGVTLQSGESLRRAAYPDPGTYVLHVETDGPLNLVIESQNRQDTMMHTSTVLYQGDAQNASFTVPEDSLVVYFNFTAGDALSLQQAVYEGAQGQGSIPLGYKLLPGFIANRLQGLWANQNAIQRLVFFSDGMKLFRRSPIVGLGLGAFENGVASVQSFYYETRYAHNHYVQALVDTGAVGLLLFVGLLAVSALAVLRERKREDAHPLTPALGAALLFMAGHAATEVVFSHYAYLPMAYGSFALIALCCGETIPVKDRRIQTGALAGMAGLLVAFALPLWGNMEASAVINRNPSFSGLVHAESLDRFEWADYALTYVVNAMSPETEDEVRLQADEYAQRLGKLNSNMIPLYLTEYYLTTGRPEEGMAMAEKYVNYVSADPEAWQSAFDLLARFESTDPAYRTGVARIKELMDAWNQEHMGSITITPETEEFLARVLA